MKVASGNNSLKAPLVDQAWMPAVGRDLVLTGKDMKKLLDKDR